MGFLNVRVRIGQHLNTKVIEFFLILLLMKFHDFRLCRLGVMFFFVFVAVAVLTMFQLDLAWWRVSHEFICKKFYAGHGDESGAQMKSDRFLAVLQTH